MPESIDIASLFDRHGAAILRRCRRMLRDDELAREALQEVFLLTISRIASFRGECSTLTWLYGIATLHCLQQLRNRNRQKAKLEDLAQVVAKQVSSEEEAVECRELLSGIAPELMEIAWLRHVEEFTLEELASVTGLTRKTVSKKLSRFIDIVHERLEGGRELAHGS